jgi:hypothetical protein
VLLCGVERRATLSAGRVGRRWRDGGRDSSDLRMLSGFVLSHVSAAEEPRRAKHEVVGAGGVEALLDGINKVRAPPLAAPRILPSLWVHVHVCVCVCVCV